MLSRRVTHEITNSRDFRFLGGVKGEGVWRGVGGFSFVSAGAADTFMSGCMAFLRISGGFG